VLARCKSRHRAADFVAFLREIDTRVDPALEVHVVLDNLSGHRAPVVHRWLLRHPRFHLHFTPTYAFWLNLVERFFGMLTEKGLRRGSHTSVAELRDAILAYVARTMTKARRSNGRRRQTRSSIRCDDLACVLNRCTLSDQTLFSNHRSRGLGDVFAVL
jgi:transposase